MKTADFPRGGVCGWSALRSTTFLPEYLSSLFVLSAYLTERVQTASKKRVVILTVGNQRPAWAQGRRAIWLSVGLGGAMLAVPLLLLSNSDASPSSGKIVRSAAHPYAGPGARVLRTAELGRRVPVEPASAYAEPTTEAPTSTEAPPVKVAERRATTTTSTAPTTTVAPRITTTAAPPTASDEPVLVAATAPASSNAGSTSEGGATWYHAPDGTCAHRTLPFGTVVTVTRVSTGTTTTCTVADRGPFVSGMIIDLSMDTFANIASTGEGIVQVRLSW